MRRKCSVPAMIDNQIEVAIRNTRMSFAIRTKTVAGAGDEAIVLDMLWRAGWHTAPLRHDTHEAILTAALAPALEPT